MQIYAADDHILAFTDAVHADFHAHLFLQVTFSLDSCFRIETENQSFECKGIILDSKIKHRFVGGNNRLLFLLIDSTSVLAQQFRRLYVEQAGFKVLEEPVIAHIQHFVMQSLKPGLEVHGYFNYFEKLLLMMGIQYGETSKMDQRVLQLLHELKTCNSSDHSLDGLAQKACLSKSRLSHLFKENTGVALSSYIVFHKLQKALTYVLKGMSITEAALKAGFDSPSHFAAVSKNLLGMSAKELSKDSVFLKVTHYE